MPLLFFIIAFIVSLRNPFSGKKYKVKLINRIILVYRSNPEIVIQDYYGYILGLLIKSLGTIPSAKIIFLECPGLRLLKILSLYSTVYLQIEHTLFRPGSRASSLGIPGALSVPSSQEKYLIRIAEFEKLQTADVILDYSRINLLNVRSSSILRDYSKKTFCISPTLYPISACADGRKGVITLFGNTEIPRRKLFLEDLKKHHIESQNISGIYAGVEKIYQDVKIVINIRQTDEYETLEELRVLPALRSGAVVICETAPYMQKTAYSQFVIWGSLEEIPDLVAEVEKNYEAVHRRIFGDGSMNSLFGKRMARIEKCNDLAMKRAIKLLNSKKL